MTETTGLPPKRDISIHPVAPPGGGVVPHGEPEKVICILRPAMFRAHPLRFLAIALLFLGGLAVIIASWLPEERGLPGWMVWAGLLGLIAATIWWTSWWVRTTLWVKLTISNRRTIHYRGIIRRSSTEVLHDHVRSVDIRQTFFQRLFNVGYLGIDSPGQDGIEIEVDDMPAPYDIKKLIDRYRRM